MPKLVDGISQKMKNFCYEYMKTGNATRAYLTAYDTDNLNTAQVESSKLLKRDDITEFLNSINRPTVNKINNERQRKRTIIWNRIERSIEKEDEAAIARYMDILNKMDAEYVNINRNVDDTSETLANLDNEQLKALLETNTAPSEQQSTDTQEG